MINSLLLILSLLYIKTVFGTVLQQQPIINPEINKQLNGDYGALKRPHIPLGSVQHAWDQQVGGVYDVEFKSNAVIKLRLRENMITTIRLPSWEKVKRVIIGDQALLNVTNPKSNIVILHPTEYFGSDTSISIVAQGHTYLFYVRVEGYESKEIPNIGVNIKAFPPHNIIKTEIKSKAITKDYLEKLLTNPADLDFKFTMSGDKEIAPEIVYSDGTRIWLYYGEKKKRMPIVSMVIDGVDSPAIVFRQKNALVVSGHGILTLRNGSKITCIHPSI